MCCQKLLKQFLIKSTIITCYFALMQYLPYFKVLEGKYFLNNHKWAKNEMTKVFGIKMIKC